MLHGVSISEEEDDEYENEEKDEGWGGEGGK